jgi:chemotaxis receptor (MCP) glutamine deamidase CheD
MPSARLPAVLSLLLALSARAGAPAVDVSMDQYIVARSGDVPVVRTFGVSTCVVLALLDPDAKVGAFTHVSAEADIPRSLDAIFAALHAAGAKDKKMTAQLFGGWRTNPDGSFGFLSTSPKMVSSLEAGMARRGIPIAREEVLVDPAHPGSVKPIRNFSFDLGTGEVAEIEVGPGVPPPSASADPAREARFQRTHLLQAHPSSVDAAVAR